MHSSLQQECCRTSLQLARRQSLAASFALYDGRYFLFDDSKLVIRANRLYRLLIMIKYAGAKTFNDQADDEIASN